jgi:hypothetical protein
MFDIPPAHIYFVYSHWQPAFTELTDKLKNITFLESLPTEEELRLWTKDAPHSLLIVDDKASQIGHSQLCENLFLRLSHHLGITVCYLLQNGALQGRYAQSITRNTHTNVIMRSAREGYYIRSLGMLLNSYRMLKECYADVCKSKLFSYLVVDTHPLSNTEFRFRTQVFPNDPVPIIYKEPPLK